VLPKKGKTVDVRAFCWLWLDQLLSLQRKRNGSLIYALFVEGGKKEEEKRQGKFFVSMTWF